MKEDQDQDHGQLEEHTHELLLRKIMGEDCGIVQGISRSLEDHQAQPNRESSSNGNSYCPAAGRIAVRVCSDCSTTKTPLWRSGPQGPKSLCNACGIRQMKARRAMRAAAAASGGLVPAGAAKKVVKKERSEVGVPLKKRFKVAQEEKDAAILLMALSCGLIHG
ncbi:putative GATA transcription factor 22 isoform X1 [Iris pallida]|uniref:GATA transcription factor 22 isoform X1 n=1 Tax=Iris pallida TaxID=29817 RepID=A0AAX6FED0_IRIPA|nr:putative GATA transcription factor 22 isoform X1 [Iris pallida]